MSAARIVEGRDNNFNLIRMIAATGVLISHAYPLTLGPGASQPLEAALKGVSLGTVSVYVFFALSGFLITKSYDTGRGLYPFVRARAYRLYPALFLNVCVTVLVAWLFLTDAGPMTFLAGVPDYAVSTALFFDPTEFLPGVFTDLPYGNTINGSLWTLSYEVACYAAVAVLGIAGLLTRRGFVLLLALCLALAVIASPWLDLASKHEKLLELALPFAVGSVLYLFRDRVPLSLPIVLALCLVAGALRPTPLFGCALILALSYGALVGGFWRSDRLQAYNRLGDYSYGTYIYAFPVQQLVVDAGVREPLLNMAIALPLTVFAAILSWHFVEGPALRRLRNRTRGMIAGQLT